MIERPDGCKIHHQRMEEDRVKLNATHDTVLKIDTTLKNFSVAATIILSLFGTIALGGLWTAICDHFDIKDIKKRLEIVEKTKIGLVKSNHEN